MTDPIKKAFEKATPGVTLEVQNRNTNAGVKYLEETKANNQVDLFWASAPDAFERGEVDALSDQDLGALRFQLPPVETLRRLSPARRQMVLDYFERLNRAARTVPGRGGTL